jgi:hypothetical protein
MAVNLEYVKDYIKNLRILASPWFCQLCVVIRGVEKEESTYLDNGIRRILYNGRGMCEKCFYHLNKEDDPEKEERLKLWEQEIGYKLKK